MLVAIVIVTLVVLFVIGGVLVTREERELKGAPVGSQKVAAVKSSRLNGTVKNYAKYGWQIEQQSTAKSFGTDARITITFRKTQQVG